MLFNLGIFHRREAKPAWWAVFNSLGREDDELLDDLDAMSGLEAVGPLVPVHARSSGLIPIHRTPSRESENLW